MNKLDSRLLTHAWRELLLARGRLQHDAVAVLHRAKVHGMKDLSLTNGGKTYTMAIMEADLELSLDAFQRQHLVSGAAVWDEPGKLA